MRPTGNLRVFVAVYPPPETAALLLRAVAALGELPDHRLVSEDQVHLTLHFIGDTPANELDRVVESVGRAAAGLAAFALTPLRLISLPPGHPREHRRAPARLIAAETDAPPALLEMHRRLALRFARTRSRPSDRFLPHLTLCRFRAPSRIAPIDSPLTTVNPFPVDSITLMRSVLAPDGARHIRVGTVELV